MKGLVLFLLLSKMACVLAVSWLSHSKMKPSTYQDRFTKYAQRGYRVQQVCGYSQDGKTYIGALWVKKSGPKWKSHSRMTSSTYQSRFNLYKNQGYRVTYVCGYAIGNKAYYSAIWEKKSGPKYVTKHRMSSSKYQSEFTKYKNQNYRLVHVHGYAVNNKDYYVAIWVKRQNGDPSIKARHRMTRSSYQNNFDSFKGSYRVVVQSGYFINGKAYYAALWEKKQPGVKPYAVRFRIAGRNYQVHFDNQKYRGYYLTGLSVYTLGSKRYLATIWHSTGAWKLNDLKHIDKTVKDFKDKHNYPGVAIAIGKNGRLVFAQGYGYANKETKTHAGPNQLWRIASVSKPITAVAIMKLLEEKPNSQISLNKKIFGSNSILGTTYGSKPYGNREKAVTVQQLLEHTAGGTTWNNEKGDGSSDPVFDKYDYSRTKMISWILDDRNPSQWPGTLYNYSNFGYVLLGRVIAKVGPYSSYETYVKEKILKPIGANNIHIGNDKYSQRFPNEVKYYSSGNPYNKKMRRMDAAAGWIASPVDLVKFLVHVDGKSNPVDVLKENSIKSMTKPSVRNSKYGKGWGIREIGSKKNWYHGGRLRGTRAMIHRDYRGYTFAFVSNSRDDSDKVYKLRENIINGIGHWPNVNYF